MRRKTTPVTAHHRYRLSQGIYPEHMASVVVELCDEVERLQQAMDELDDAFYRWRQRRTERRTK